MGWLVRAEARRPLDEITGAIVDSALKIHRGIGPGLLESVYETILARDLARRGFRVERQQPVPFEFDGLRFDNALRIDLFVDRRVIVEIKSVDRLAPVYSKQVLTYLRLLKLPVGLLINFGGETLREGLVRIVNKLEPSAAPRLRVNQWAANNTRN
jgi:iron complex transport system substrate-binding protein